MKTILAFASTLIILSSCAAGSMASSKVYTDRSEGSSMEMNEEALAKRGPNSSAVTTSTEPRIASSEKIGITELPTMVLAGLRKAYPTKTIVEITKHTGNQENYYEFRLHERKHKDLTVVFNSSASQVSLP